MKNQISYQQKRNELKELSKPLIELKKDGKLSNINEGLKDIYSQQGHTELKTINQWKEEGKSIRKNSQALYVWGKQRKGKSKESGEEFNYFPIIPLFSKKQVYTSKN